MKLKNLPWNNGKQVCVEESSVKKLSPFDMVKCMQRLPGYVCPDFASDEFNKAYVPFLINKSISDNPTYLPAANEMNRYPDCPKQMQYMFYDSFIPKRKEYFAFLRKSDDAKFDRHKEGLSKYYECGTRDLKLSMKLLSEKQKEEIASKFDEKHIVK